MADTAKYAPISGGTLITHFKNHFSVLNNKRSVTCAYGFVFVFIAFTIFLAFSPSSNSATPWFTNIFSTSFSSSSNGTSASDFSNESYRSHFSSVFSYFFPNASTQAHNSTSQPSPASFSRSPDNRTEQLNFNKEPTIVNNQTQTTELNDKDATFKPNQSVVLAPTSPETLNMNNTTNTSPPPETSSETNEGSSFLKNQTQSEELDGKGETLGANQNTIGVTESSVTANQTVNSSTESSSGEKNITSNGEISIAANGVIENVTSSLSNKQRNNEASPGVSAKQGVEDLVKSLMNCDLYDGNWVKDETYPLYKPGSCSLIDEQFNCLLNGRPDHDYYKLKWKPKGCTLPRLNGAHMLELLRGRRLAFVGDSLNRNMWESLICILRNSVKDQKKVYEESGRHNFRGEASYSFVFEEYKCRVEFYVSPFLVQEWEVAEQNGTKKETLRLDLIGSIADRYRTADVITFNTGHWWTHEKTSKGKDYYQEGSHVYSELNVLEAFRKALTTWGKWVDANIDPRKTHVMFRGYSETHFSGGQWNSGGQCDNETEPIKNERYLRPYSSKMVVFEEVMRGMKTHVSYLNITRLTDYRKDGHPSIYRKQNLSEEERRSSLRIQDCSHWCLPGVPDAWNELLYAELLVEQMKKHQYYKVP